MDKLDLIAGICLANFQKGGLFTQKGCRDQVRQAVILANQILLEQAQARVEMGEPELALNLADLAVKIVASTIMVPVDIQSQYITLNINAQQWGGAVLTARDISLDLAKLDVNLSTRASQATLASVLARLNVNLSTVASQATLATRASEATLASVLTNLNTHKYTTPANSGVDVGIASTLIKALNASRLYLAIVNDSDTVVYLGIGAAAVLNQGIRLNASGGSYEINWENLYTGAIYGIHGDTGNKRVTVVEGD